MAIIKTKVYCAFYLLAILNLRQICEPRIFQGVMRDSKDLSLFDDEFRTNFEPKEVDFFDEKNW